MSRARHGKSGGTKPMKVSGNPDVFKEAAARKRGGKAVSLEGGKPKHHFGRPGRKTGGRVGADKSPLSSAHGTTSASKSPN